MEKKRIIDRLLICREKDITCTGGVVFIGDGAVGKTHTAMNLASYKKGSFFNFDCSNISKSVNLEFDYFILYSNIEKYKVTISSQLFIMPGQKGRAEVGQGLAFEDAVDMYFNVRSINDVIILILTYSLSDVRTFQNLEYWLNKAIDHELISDFTNIVLLGTHLDYAISTSVSDEMIEAGQNFISQSIEDKLGFHFDPRKIHNIKISNLTKVGVDDLQEAVSNAFFNAFQIEDFVYGQEKEIVIQEKEWEKGLFDTTIWEQEKKNEYD